MSKSQKERENGDIHIQNSHDKVLEIIRRKYAASSVMSLIHCVIHEIIVCKSYGQNENKMLSR